MSKRKTLWGIFAAAAMAVLILDGKTALQGAAAGITLCLEAVIPSLFPFIILSGLLTDAMFGTPLALLRPLGRWLSMPAGSESLLLCAFLGGYPSGAAAVGGAFRKGSLTRQEAERLLAFCSNAGPAFLFGMTARLFAPGWIPWVLWGIHILSAVAAGRLFPAADCAPVHLERRPFSPAALIRSSLGIMGSVCAWVVLFRIVMAFLERWFLWILPVAWRVAFTGALELTNGVCSLPLVEDPRMRMLLCSGMLAFGGLCVTMQTVSVTAGLSLRKYCLGKLVQTLVSILLSALIAPWIL